MEAVSQDPQTLRYTSPELRGDRGVVMKAVSQDPSTLQHASAELKGDSEIVMQAVSQGSWSAERATPALQGDREIVMAAVTAEPRTLSTSQISSSATARLSQRLCNIPQQESARLRGDREVVSCVLLWFRTPSCT